MPFPLPEERQAEILSRLQRDGRILAAGLADEFSTSEDTIRRDLRDLAAAGLCRRVYGGALPLSPASGPVRDRESVGVEAKRRLAAAAVSLAAAGHTILIDSGSTNLCIAQALPDGMPLTVITNAPAAAAALVGRASIDLVVIGGRIDPQIGASFGARALRDLIRLHADLAFLGACAISAGGVAVFDSEEAEFKRAAVERTNHAVVALTNDKLSTAAPFGFASLDAIGTLVVQPDAPDAVLQGLGFQPARLLRAAQPPKALRS